MEQDLPIRMPGEFWWWCAQILDDLLELVTQALARHKGLSPIKLPYNAPDCPHVDGFSIVIVAQNKLGRPVPAGSHIVCDGHRGELVLRPDGTSKTKVANF